MKKLLIFGNSGSGKSTLARQLSASEGLAHFDLDTVAWQPSMPPTRRPVADSAADIQRFIRENQRWVIEGCYADLLELLLPDANELVFLNLPVALCIENARNRPWEPHKYESKAAQDSNLAMLIDWIAQYEVRDDEFSLTAHQALFDDFGGKKTMLFSNTDSQKFMRNQASAGQR